jgi:hypothetical protein
MFTQNPQYETFQTSADLSACAGLAVKVSSAANFFVELAGAGEGDGVLTNKPKAGEGAQVAVGGVEEGVAGATIYPNQPITAAASGFLIPATSGQKCFGTARTGAASGMLVSVKLGKFYLPNSII